MKIVAESQEALQVPLSARQGLTLVDPSVAGSRSVSIALRPQGEVAESGDFTIVGTWVDDDTVTPTRYWIEFNAPGDLERGTAYQGYAKLAPSGSDIPILMFPNLIEAV